MLHVPVAIGVMVKVGDGGCAEMDATPAHVLVCENEPTKPACATLSPCAKAAPRPVNVSADGAGTTAAPLGVAVGVAVGVALGVAVGVAVTTGVAVGVGVGVAPAGVAVGTADAVVVGGGGPTTGTDAFCEQPAATITIAVATIARGLSM
jgi:hypothetical protein